MAEETESTPSKWGLMGIFKAAAILSMLVVVQVVAAAFVIPSPHDVEKLARDLAVAEKGNEFDSQSTEDTLDGAAAPPEKDLREVLIDQFSITRYNVEADKTVNIDFEVYATVLAAEEEEYLTLFDSNKNRVKEQINLTIHAAEPTDLTDRGLGLIKRKILERTNRALGKPLVREIFLTRFNFVQR